jgi:FkbM family methyltransferase
MRGLTPHGLVLGWARQAAPLDEGSAAEVLRLSQLRLDRDRWPRFSAARRGDECSRAPRGPLRLLRTRSVKRLIRAFLARFGYEIARPGRAGSAQRPFGSMRHTLEDLRARGFTCRTVLDVGANQCHWSGIAAGVFPESNFVLVEPQTEMLPHLEAFCRSRAGRRYVLAAASACAGETTLHIARDLAGSSLLAPPPDDEASAAGTRTVPTVRLDDIIGPDLPGLVKLDIQGLELEALRGASRILAAAEALILEVSLYEFLPGQAVFHDVEAFLWDRGYCLYDFAGFLRRPHDGALGQFDACYVRRDGRLRRSASWA